MRSFVYPANLSPEKGGGFTVQFPDLPEAITSGKNRADALLQAADCLEEAIAGRIADRLDVPLPTDLSQFLARSRFVNEVNRRTVSSAERFVFYHDDSPWLSQL